MYANASAAVQKYQQISTESTVPNADPYRLVMMLLDGAIARIATAKGHMQRQEIARKGQAMGKVIDIIQGLRASLDHDAGGEIAGNLDALYDYILRRLLLAHANNDEKILDEVSGLVGEIRAGWRGIEDQVKQLQM